MRAGVTEGGARMNNLDTILAVVASVVTIAGGLLGIARYLERSQWKQNRGRAGVVIGAVLVAVVTVLTGSTLAVLQREKQPQQQGAANGPCAGLAEFSGAASPSLGTAFATVPFLPNSPTSAGNTFEIDSYQFKILHVCTTSFKDAGEVRGYYESVMPDEGWAQSRTFPVDGDAKHQCGGGADTTNGDDATSPDCWSQDNRYVSLQTISAIRDSTNTAVATTYYLWLAVAPITSSATISRNSTYAFENVTVDPSGDIQWLQRGRAAQVVGPAERATLACIGQVDFNSYPVSDLEHQAFSATPLSTGDGDCALAAGNVFGVYTNADHYVKVQVESVATALQIEWVLYPYVLD